MPKKASETKKEEKRPLDLNGVVVTGKVTKVVYDSDKMSLFTIGCQITDKFTSYITCKVFASDVDLEEIGYPSEDDEIGIAGILSTEKYTDKKTKKDVYSTFIKVKELSYDLEDFRKKWKK